MPRSDLRFSRLRWRYSAVVAWAGLVVGFAVFGPLYGRATLASVTRASLSSASVAERGLSLFSDAAQLSPDTMTGLVPPEVTSSFDPPVRQLRVDVAGWPASGASPRAQLVWRDHACAHVVIIAGRCPGAAGEVVVEQGVAQDLGWRVGRVIRIGQEGESVPSPARASVISVRVVGTYRQRSDPEYWHGAGALSSEPGAGVLFTTPETFQLKGQNASGASTDWVRVANQVDYALRVGSIGTDDLLRLGPLLSRFAAEPLGLGSSPDIQMIVTTGLPGIASDVALGRSQSTVTVTLLAGQLTVLLTVLFWLAVRGAAVRLRSDVARLRGHGVRGARRLAARALLPPAAVGYLSGGGSVLRWDG